MPKVKKVASFKNKLVEALNRPLEVPRGLSSVCKKEGEQFKITKIYGLTDDAYKKDAKILNVNIENLMTKTQNNVFLAHRNIKFIMADPELYKNKKNSEQDFSDLVGLCFEVIELRKYGDNTYPEIRFYVDDEQKKMPKKKRVVKLPLPSKAAPPLINDSDDNEDDDHEDEEDIDDVGDWPN